MNELSASSPQKRRDASLCIYFVFLTWRSGVSTGPSASNTDNGIDLADNTAQHALALLLERVVFLEQNVGGGLRVGREVDRDHGLIMVIVGEEAFVFVKCKKFVSQFHILEFYEAKDKCSIHYYPLLLDEGRDNGAAEGTGSAVNNNAGNHFIFVRLVEGIDVRVWRTKCE